MAVISAEVVFIITTQHEYSNFDSAYKEVSSELIQTFYKRIDNALWVAQSVAANIKELSVGEHWPYVFIPSFDSLCEGPLHLSQASVITFSPLIEASKQGEWESFAAMSYPLTRQGGSEEVTGMDNVTYYHTNRTLSDGIYRFDNATSVDADTVRPFFVPIWQMSPSPQTNNTIDLVGILFDEASNRVRGSALDQMMKHTGSAMSSFLFQNNNLTDMAFYQSPRSNLYYPIVNDSVAPRTIVGSIDLQFKWETALQDAVEDYNETIIVVVQNSCGGNYTYQVNGVHAKYLGPGDHHDSTVGDYVVSSSSYATFASLFDEHGEVQIDIQTACNYRITVYPSTTFQDNVSLFNEMVSSPSASHFSKITFC